MAESVEEGLGGFEGEACGFPASESVIRVCWLGFVRGEFARLVAEVCDAWERIGVQREVVFREREARKVRRKRTGSVVGHNFKIEEYLPQKL